MKRFFMLFAMFASCACAMSQNHYSATDSRITYVGRTLCDESNVSFDWAATYMRMSFTGTYLAIRISDSGKNYFNLWVDREMSAEPDEVLTFTGEDTTIVLYQSKKKGSHTVILQKRTEGEQGRVTVKDILVKGDLKQAPTLKSRQIEFIGDSYTCGYGAEKSGRKDRFTPETETCTKSYASILARYFDADYMLIAHSGMGVARNYNSKFAGWAMPLRYTRTFDMDSTETYVWKSDQCLFRPNLTVIFLGANDFSVGLQPSYPSFKEQYIRLLKSIKQNYGENHPVLCCTKKGQDYLFAYVQQIAQECGMKNVSYVGLFATLFHDDDRNLGADFHPNYEAHRKIAHVLAPYIATITEWELQNRPIE